MLRRRNDTQLLVLDQQNIVQIYYLNNCVRLIIEFIVCLLFKLFFYVNLIMTTYSNEEHADCNVVYRYLDRNTKAVME